ncbi:MAG TPA: winged helix DNA-binding domain-containing protein, partial [Planctomycetota bacterium]|nr:winged helix DNA-binding domain-containing protein [Planctomycetota bacterium]
TWPMRGTLHYVAAEDARWMLRLLAPRVVQRAASRYRQLELDTAAFTRSRRILEKALRGGKCFTRPEAYARLEKGGVKTGEQRGIHILGWLAMQRHLCFGPRRGKQPTFTLLEEWLPPADDPPRDEALGRLAARYFQSHAPATASDFAWWTGLPLGEARRALDVAGIAPDAPARGARERVPAPLVALLPPWDEYLVAYRDRGDAFGHLPAGANPIGIPVLVVDGRVQGAWTRRVTPSTVHLDVQPWAPLGVRERRALARAAARYARFAGRELDLTISS